MPKRLHVLAHMEEAISRPQRVQTRSFAMSGLEAQQRHGALEVPPVQRDQHVRVSASASFMEIRYVIILLLAVSRAYAQQKLRDEQVKETINQKLIESGEKERCGCVVRALAFVSAITDVWNVELIKTKGIDQITVDDLVDEITPKGRCTPAFLSLSYDRHLTSFVASVPDSIKADMLERIRLFLEASS
ncbi:hypothetical protein DYB26_013584 [Aphanomyces astaci]|uniref:Uncharacterized protein n=1 Tax=Aphanomyces astaci TaxID=112090 RepID=A0A3R7A838_APHAT|nr:hypothetical protein DYB26_013584 [Aphanomyces astaci]